MKSYQISIVTVCQEQLGKLQWSLRSLLGQEVPSIEWVVVYPETCTEVAAWLATAPYGDLKGVSVPSWNRYEAMSRGVAAASGAYVLFLEAGNRFYSSTTVQAALSRLTAHCPDILVGSTEYITRYGVKVVQLLPFEVIRRELPFRLESAFIRRSLLTQYPFDTQYHWAADYAFLRTLPPLSIRELRYPVTVVDRKGWWNHPDSIGIEREYRCIQGRMHTIWDKLNWCRYLMRRGVGNFLRMILPDCLFPNREDNRDLYR